MPGGLRHLRVERVTQQEERADGGAERLFAAPMMAAPH
jgi:hypothetical protein